MTDKRLNKIPTFPEFKPLELNDKEELELLVQQFEPYSDYNFVSLWSYNVKEDIQISKLNNNLVVRFSDYITGEGFYSFLGDSSLEETIDTLIKHSEFTGLKPYLKLIPEKVISESLSSVFYIEEDRDNFDHIFSTQEIGLLSGSKFENKRNKVNFFTKNYPQANIQILRLSDQAIHNNILKLFKVWVENKSQSLEETENELVAIKRLLEHSDKFNLIGLGVFNNNELVAFSITEIVHQNYSMFHFAKADKLYKGLYEFLYHKTAQELHKRGSLFLNREQDLGIPGLRAAKESWRPINHLKKYKITHKTI